MGVLDGKVAIVTGAGRGIGREIALDFARNGASVLVNDLGSEADGTGASGVAEEVAQEIRSAGGEAASNGDSVATVEGDSGSSGRRSTPSGLRTSWSTTRGFFETGRSSTWRRGTGTR